MVPPASCSLSWIPQALSLSRCRSEQCSIYVSLSILWHLDLPTVPAVQWSQSPWVFEPLLRTFWPISRTWIWFRTTSVTFPCIHSTSSLVTPPKHQWPSYPVGMSPKNAWTAVSGPLSAIQNWSVRRNGPLELGSGNSPSPWRQRFVTIAKLKMAAIVRCVPPSQFWQPFSLLVESTLYWTWNLSLHISYTIHRHFSW